MAMASRMRMHILRRVPLSHCIAAARVLVARCSPLDTTVRFISIFGDHNERGLARDLRACQASHTWSGVKHMSSDGRKQSPALSDPQVKNALNALLATSWSKLDKDLSREVEAALTRDDGVLSSTWSAARASERFSETLTYLRMELDDLSGSDGEAVQKLPDSLVRALEAAFSKYSTYLQSFGEDEVFLKQKVEMDIGNILVQIKQRCSGLDPKWGTISLLGTSGLSGSYIERRRTT